MGDNKIEERTTLRFKHSKARNLIQKQIKEGKILRTNEVTSKDKLQEIQTLYLKWTKYNIHLLENMFSDSKQANEYSKGLGVYRIRTRMLAEEIEAFKEDIFKKISKLESIENSLDLFEFKKGNNLFSPKWFSIGGLGLFIAIIVLFFGDNIICRIADKVPVLSLQPKSEVIYSRIEKDSIFKDSMFGEIPFKSFEFKISNIGDIQADNISIQLNSFVGMDLGYDPNLILIGNPSSVGLNIESRLFHRRVPLAPQASSLLKLVMFKPAYDSLSSLNNSNLSEIPSIHIEYPEGIAKKIPDKRIN